LGSCEGGDVTVMSGESGTWQRLCLKYD
jgi:hypothetical protein